MQTSEPNSPWLCRNLQLVEETVIWMVYYVPTIPAGHMFGILKCRAKKLARNLCEDMTFWLHFSLRRALFLFSRENMILIIGSNEIL